MLKFLELAIGLIARGPDAKGKAGGISGSILLGFQPLVDAFQSGLLKGAEPGLEQLGIAIGQAAIGWLVGYALAWVAPKNKRVIVEDDD